MRENTPCRLVVSYLLSTIRDLKLIPPDVEFGEY